MTMTFFGVLSHRVPQADPHHGIIDCLMVAGVPHGFAVHAQAGQEPEMSGRRVQGRDDHGGD
jgi:hypothetical protein